jgi:hypothetical protein
LTERPVDVVAVVLEVAAGGGDIDPGHAAPLRRVVFPSPTPSRNAT